MTKTATTLGRGKDDFEATESAGFPTRKRFTKAGIELISVATPGFEILNNSNRYEKTGGVGGVENA